LIDEKRKAVGGFHKMKW